MSNDLTEKIEHWRKWGSTLILVIIVPVGGLYMKASRLEIMAEVQTMFVSQKGYDIDHKELAICLEKIEGKLEVVGTHLQAISENQAATQEHLRAIEERGKKL